MIARLFKNEKFILFLILLNTITIFMSGFDLTQPQLFTISSFDNFITFLFLIELVIKINSNGFYSYWSSNWNKMDFILVLVSVPSLILFLVGSPQPLSILLVFRVLRVFKSFRFIKFIPGIEHIMNGLTRALKASVIILISFVVYIFIIGIFSFNLFQEISPEYFGDPLKSLYSIFKMFTMEGWYEIPESLVTELSTTLSFLTFLYFIFVVLTGGIFGLSLVNSIFVDAMVSDNNDDLERKIDLLNEKIDSLLTIKKDKL